MRLLIVLCLALLCSPASAREFAIDHLEPANWWIGMKHDRVELMVHGPGIGALTPRLSHPGVTVAAVEKGENPNYLFVTLAIAPEDRKSVV